MLPVGQGAPHSSSQPKRHWHACAPQQAARGAPQAGHQQVHLTDPAQQLVQHAVCGNRECSGAHKTPQAAPWIAHCLPGFSVGCRAVAGQATAQGATAQNATLTEEDSHEQVAVLHIVLVLQQQAGADTCLLYTHAWLPAWLSIHRQSAMPAQRTPNRLSQPSYIHPTHPTHPGTCPPARPPRARRLWTQLRP